MPYVKQSQRDLVDANITAIASTLLSNPANVPGLLNYTITKLLWLLFTPKHLRNYANANSLVGVLECAKAEFLRRQVAPYEDEKIKENGDIESPVVLPKDAPMVGAEWSSRDDSILRLRVTQGVSTDAIARDLGRTSTAIIYRMVNLSLKYGGRK